ncbi:CFEM domain-containing protein [Pochonia chlamydosporia 170]|uniref:CFEM domain-containing protein n=1 Tax=Pochonia chlamydosporia 170 TaxID=1380566 RepID=A0A219AP78_METCM|nr:CFEM domain-containing protein [Pochonia chlamydosporia 170]OWT42637.1 CFEM domain-containing protein [Pochonia chlamydosporia 170]
MARTRSRVNLAICSISLLLLQTVSAGRIPVYPSPTPVLDLSPFPVVTAAPSPDQVNKRLEKRTAIVNSCATGCIASAVTKSTECKLGDTACECEPVNASAVLWGAFSCIESACEALSAVSVICVSVLMHGSTSSVGVVATSSSSGASPTSGGLDGNSGSGNSGSGNSGGGGSSGNNSGNGNSSGSGGSSNTSSNGLSSGAIAGVAIGAAAIVVIAAALVYYFCVQKKRQDKLTAANAASVGLVGDNQPPMGSIPPASNAGGKPPTQVAMSTTPINPNSHPPSTLRTSPYTNTMNTVSPISGRSPPIYPGTTELAAGGWQQQHQVEVNGVYSPQSAQTLVGPNAPQG